MPHDCLEPNEDDIQTVYHCSSVLWQNPGFNTEDQLYTVELSNTLVDIL